MTTELADDTLCGSPQGSNADLSFSCTPAAGSTKTHYLPDQRAAARSAAKRFSRCCRQVNLKVIVLFKELNDLSIVVEYDDYSAFAKWCYEPSNEHDSSASIDPRSGQ